MRAGIVVKVTRADRRRLEAIVSDRSAAQKHVWRAQIILATADGCGTAEIMRRSGKAKSVVWTWQARFMAEGVDGLLRDKTRKPGKPALQCAPVVRTWMSAFLPAPLTIVVFFQFMQLTSALRRDLFLSPATIAKSCFKYGIHGLNSLENTSCTPSRG